MIQLPALEPAGPGFRVKRGADASLPEGRDVVTQEKRRERRIRDRLRMEAKARRIYPDQPKAVWRADYLASCSCALCGNPRRVWKCCAETRQETRARLAEADED